MKQRIVVPRGSVNHLAKTFGCTPEMVWKALTYRSSSPLAQRIRQQALNIGGVEVGAPSPRIA